MVHYVSASALTLQVRQCTVSGKGRNTANTFGQLLHKASSIGEIRDCPSSCGAKIQICRTLMNRPEIVSVGIVWDSEKPAFGHTVDIFAAIGTSFNLNDVFHGVVDKRWVETTIHNLVGMVTYHGKHYSTFFFHTKLCVWIYIDDETVKEVGHRWEHVVEKCTRGRHLPLLLLYTAPNGTPINIENTPKQTTSFDTDKSLTKQVASQSLLRRSTTPNPEKPNVGSTSKAVTPIPNVSKYQKFPSPINHGEYQNLLVIPNNLSSQQGTGSVDTVDEGIRRIAPEYVTTKSQSIVKAYHKNRQQISVRRTNSSGSSSGIEVPISDHTNMNNKRDSGSWSGDRNSGSSSSSTTMENPYLYLVGKKKIGNENAPGSPTSVKFEPNCVYDAGYDSYSLSSNDSSTMSTIHHLMKMGHLAQIPEQYENAKTQSLHSCDALCDEADELLVKSRQLEDEGDLVLALALCNAAATKARSAMNVPYNNQQTLTLARMKHNTCIMRARSLHRRMTQMQNPPEKPPEIRHTREGSSGSGRHSRQNSRDKIHHSRQSSRELPVNVAQDTFQVPNKSIEIYATLPKKRDISKIKSAVNSVEDEGYILYGKTESWNLFSRSKNKNCTKIREKRSRSEDRTKILKDFSVAHDMSSGKNNGIETKAGLRKDERNEKKEKDSKNKKQHKIRRKLLMGGLIKHKNRSMPDLTSSNTNGEKGQINPFIFVDDTKAGMKDFQNIYTMCGYSSEGHLEFSGKTTNPNLERSKLMRKNCHGNAGKGLTAAKVPPPPPLRTTSQLTSLKQFQSDPNDSLRLQYSLPDKDEGSTSNYNTQYFEYNNCTIYCNEPVSVPHLRSYNTDMLQNKFSVTNSKESHYGYSGKRSPTMIVTQADVHQEQSPLKCDNIYKGALTGNSVDKVDGIPFWSSTQSLELPPYPSPASSIIHSRQPSEDFPPPPPPLDLSALDEYLTVNQESPSMLPNLLLTKFQDKRQQILSQECTNKQISENSTFNGDQWLSELQAKQTTLKMEGTTETNSKVGTEENDINNLKSKTDASKATSVKDLASRFENIQVQPSSSDNISKNIITRSMQKYQDQDKNFTFNQIKNKATYHGVLPMKNNNSEIIANEIPEVEMLGAAVEKTFQKSNDITQKNKAGKKKSVSFCDQVILVATADDQEEDSYIPNPILERVLRNAMNKSEIAKIRQEIINLRKIDHAAIKEKFLILKSQAELENLGNINLQYPTYGEESSSENSKQCAVTPQEKEPNYGIQQEIQYPLNENEQFYYTTSIPHNNQFQYRQTHQQVPSINFTQMKEIKPQSNPPFLSYCEPSYNLQSQESQECTSSRNGYKDLSLLHVSNVRRSPTHLLCSTCADDKYYSNNYSSHQLTYSACHHNKSSFTYNTNYENAYLQNQQQARQNSPYQQLPQTNNEITSQICQAGQHSDYNQPMNSAMYQCSHNCTDNNCVYQTVPCYQKPVEENLNEMSPSYIHPVTKHSTYQELPPQKHAIKKSDSFEFGIKSDVDTKVLKPLLMPILVNNSYNCVNVLGVKTKCILCRKKSVGTPNSYCSDCQFYMSRFEPKT